MSHRLAHSGNECCDENRYPLSKASHVDGWVFAGQSERSYNPMREVAMMTLLLVLAGVAAVVVMMAASRFAIHHAVAVAEKLNLPPFLIG